MKVSVFMRGRDESKFHGGPGQYDANYGNFQTKLYEEIRREAFGEDIGQNSWLTAAEQDRFLTWLDLCPGKRLLDVACGAGGPALRIAARTGSSVVGVDIHDRAIVTAGDMAIQRGLSNLAEFRLIDAAQELPFPSATFDAIICVDAITHLADRPRVMADWARLLKPRGRLLFTDSTVVTGPLTSAEIAVRSSVGFYQFVPIGYNEKLMAECGMQALLTENVTLNMANVAERRRMARASKSRALREIEGEIAFNRQQEFLGVAAQLAREGRLSRFLYVSSLS